MLLNLILSSIVSGLVATALMIVALYLPLLWRGVYYDTLGGIGAIYLRRVDERGRLLGAMTLVVGGVLFAMVYGAFVLMFTRGPFPAPDYTVLSTWPTPLNLFYPLLGLVGGLGQGIFVTLIATFIVTDFHPLPAYRDPFPLVLSFLVGHLVYGVTVMTFQSQLLALLGA